MSNSHFEGFEDILTPSIGTGINSIPLKHPWGLGRFRMRNLRLMRVYIVHTVFFTFGIHENAFTTIQNALILQLLGDCPQALQPGGLCLCTPPLRTQNLDPLRPLPPLARSSGSATDINTREEHGAHVLPLALTTNCVPKHRDISLYIYPAQLASGNPERAIYVLLLFLLFTDPQGQGR